MKDIWEPYKNFRKFAEKNRKIKFVDHIPERFCNSCKETIYEKEWLGEGFIDICGKCANLSLETRELVMCNNICYECDMCYSCAICKKIFFRGNQHISFLNNNICGGCYDKDMLICEYLEKNNYETRRPFVVNNDTICIEQRNKRIVPIYCYISLSKEIKYSKFTPSFHMNKRYCKILPSLIEYKCAYIDDLIGGDFKKYFTIAKNPYDIPYDVTEDIPYDVTDDVPEVTEDIPFNTREVLNVKKEDCVESIMHWAILEEAPYLFSAGLLININDEEQIAAYSHGEQGYSIFVIFKSFDNYKKAREIWEETRKSLHPDRINAFSEYANFSAYCGIITNLYYCYD